MKSSREDTLLGRARNHYVTFHSTCYPDGRSVSHYHVPGQGLLDPGRFNDWLTEASGGDAAGPPFQVCVLVIREFRDPNGGLHGCILERRRRTADGEYYGDPARIEVSGPALQVSAYRATAGGGLQGICARPELPLDRPTRDILFSGEDRAIRATYGQATRVVAVREPSALEELVGFSSIVHLLTPDGRELACAIGWHGTTPFLIQGEFPPTDGHAAGAADILLGGEWQDLLTKDQAVWLRYAERFENLEILEVRAEEMTDDVLVLTGDAGGCIAWHLIDGDGVELWRKTPEELLADSPNSKGMPVPGSEANSDRPDRDADVCERARRA